MSTASRVMIATDFVINPLDRDRLLAKIIGLLS